MFRISIDQGGTFADGVLVDDRQSITVAKVETDPAEPSNSIMDCIALLAQGSGLTLKQLLGSTQTVSICTTLGTNAILEGKGAKCCLLHTEGFRDTFELGRTMPKEDIYNLKVPAPKVLIPRYLRFGVRERLDYRGNVITPLNEDDVRAAVEKAKQHGVEIPVIGFLHSYINPAHEEQAAEIVRADYPNVVVSSKILRRWIEYDRISTAAMAAYVKPRFTRFVQALEGRLEDEGFAGTLLFGTAMGDITTAKLAVENPATIIASGVANGALMARFLAEQCDFKNVVSIDMGGTSADIAVLAGRLVPTTTDTVIGDQKNAVESIDTTSIGAGGGSIARIDRLGVVRVGPESAGANPGPACYGKGGQSPTVTDADVVLGYVPMDYFLGGTVAGDAGLAEKAIREKVAQPLGMDLVEAANNIVSLAESSMSERVFLSVVEKGYDPRDFVLISGGGAGPVHAAAIAKRLGIRQVYIPKHAAVLSALGGMAADYGYVLTRFLHRRDDQVDFAQVDSLYGSMEKEATGIFADQGLKLEEMLLVRGAEMRYFGQLRDLSINLSEVAMGTPFTPDALYELIATFHERHRAMFGWGDPGLPVVIGLLKLRVVAKRQPLVLRKGAAAGADGADPGAAFKRYRRAYFKEVGGFVDETPCYDGGKIRPGNVIAGPAIIEEATTTVVIPPGCQAAVDAYENYLVTVGAPPATEAAAGASRGSAARVVAGIAAGAAATPVSVGSLTLAVVEARLNAMNQELGTRLFRQCFSVPTSHIRDVGTVLFDGAERTLSIGNFMPVHTGGSHVSLKGMLDYFGRDNIGPDDFIIANHPFIVKFGHLADWSFLRPIFYKGELVFYHFCRTHQYDSGGAYPGCYFPRSYDCHGEGLILPPIKIVEGGKVNESLYSIVLANVRGSTLVRADNMIVYGSMKEIENRISVLLDEYGRDTVEAACDELIRRAREAMRSLIATWPAGTYYAERAADWDGTTDKLVWVRLALTVKPEQGKLVFDFSQSDRQVDFINVPIGQVWSSVSSALLWSLPSDIPRNQGFFDSIEIITKPGSVLDPEYPATSACQSVTLGQQIGECVQLTLSEVSPKDAPALWGRHVNPLYAGKRRDMIDPRTGSIQEYTAHTFHAAPSSGASFGYDGVDGSGSSPLGGAMVRAPIEVEEWLIPYRWLRYEFLRDSAGAGEWRGGLGTHVESLNVYDPSVWQPLDCLTMTGNADGEVYGSEGLAGGTGGTKTYMEIVKKDGERVHYRTFDMKYLEPGETLVTNSGGGGGYGHPRDREIEKVRMDALNEYISLKTAREVYGVAVDPGTFAVDEGATTALREELRRRP